MQVSKTSMISLNLNFTSRIKTRVFKHQVDILSQASNWYTTLKKVYILPHKTPSNFFLRNKYRYQLNNFFINKKNITTI